MGNGGGGGAGADTMRLSPRRFRGMSPTTTATLSPPLGSHFGVGTTTAVTSTMALNGGGGGSISSTPVYARSPTPNLDAGITELLDQLSRELQQDQEEAAAVHRQFQSTPRSLIDTREDEHWRSYTKALEEEQRQLRERLNRISDDLSVTAAENKRLKGQLRRLSGSGGAGGGLPPLSSQTSSSNSSAANSPSTSPLRSSLHGAAR